GAARADDPMNCGHPGRVPLVGDAGGTHGRDALAEPGTQIVVLRLDNRYVRGTHDELALAADQDEVAVAVEPAGRVDVPFHAGENRKACPYRMAEFQQDWGDNELRLGLLGTNGQGQVNSLPDECLDLRPHRYRGQGGEQVGVMEPQAQIPENLGKREI